jgi:hypothetical protein
LHGQRPHISLQALILPPLKVRVRSEVTVRSKVRVSARVRVGVRIRKEDPAPLAQSASAFFSSYFNSVSSKGKKNSFSFFSVRTRGGVLNVHIG